MMKILLLLKIKKGNWKKIYKIQGMWTTERHNDTTDEEERRGDDENDVIMEPSIDTNICIICGEFGRNQELWYRCTICAAWAHSECS
ncbi:hypothetical protein C0J52_28101 [Blattella germanica]|nr:hypothetical protein C0J52_28101 [Blattella germanica]